jgi:hypothetical protein
VVPGTGCPFSRKSKSWWQAQLVSITSNVITAAKCNVIILY